MSSGAAKKNKRKRLRKAKERTAFIREFYRNEIRNGRIRWWTWDECDIRTLLNAKTDSAEWLLHPDEYMRNLAKAVEETK